MNKIKLKKGNVQLKIVLESTELFVKHKEGNINSKKIAQNSKISHFCE